MTSVEVIYAARMQPGDLFAGLINPDAPTTPVQTWARALRLTGVTPYAGEDERKMLRLQAGSLTLTPVPAADQVLVIREQEPSQEPRPARRAAPGGALAARTVESEARREWQAADAGHALEQHRDAFPGEAVSGVWLATEHDGTPADQWTRHGEPLTGAPGQAVPQPSRAAGASSPQDTGSAGDTEDADTSRLTELADSLGADWWELADRVHDVASRMASQVNNDGDQIGFLVREAGPAAAEQMIRAAVHGTGDRPAQAGHADAGPPHPVPRPAREPAAAAPARRGSSTESLIDAVAEREGWTERTLLGVLIGYLGNQGSDDALRDYLLKSAAG